MPQLLLELLSEEIPARMQAQAARDLERMAREKLAADGFLPEAVKSFAGPRRLTLVIEGLPAAQPDRHEDVKGPRVGAPEQALEGFLRKSGLTKDQLVERDGVWFAHIHKPGRATPQIVAEIVEQIVRAFPWPKSMVSGTSKLRWVRPLKRILCVFDREVVPFEIEGIASGDLTEGHRFMGSGQPLRVRDFDEYQEALAREFVVLDAEERKARIMDAARTLCFARNFELVEDEGLLEEVAGLAEWPTPVMGDMDPAFLDLPPEVIRTSMRVHQRYFAVRDPQTGKLAPHFITVANIEAIDGGRTIAKGNAKVLSARLNDARFFWNEDLGKSLESRLEKLKGVTFHAKLGTMYERVERITALARELAPFVRGDDITAAKAEQAARLAKADLVSGMVGEFPELQGIMGGYYAEKEGLDPEVVDAIRHHYRPQGPNDAVPVQAVAATVALADKLDTLVSFFAIGEKPTGSRDPFALRRSALGVLRIVLTNRLRIDLFGSLSDAVSRVRARAEELAQKARVESFVTKLASASSFEDLERAVEIDANTRRIFGRMNAGRSGTFKDDLILIEVLVFIFDRLAVHLREDGVQADRVAAVREWLYDQHMPPRVDLWNLVGRVKALDSFLATDDGRNLLAGYKRAVNILKAEKTPPSGEPVDMPTSPSEERALIAAVGHAELEIGKALEREDFEGAMRELSALRPAVDAFFDRVLVNSEVSAERENRLRLLVKVRDAMGRVADFSQVTG